MKRCIIQADDYGYNEAATRGVEITYQYGITTSTTAMVTFLDPSQRSDIRDRFKKLENRSGLHKPPLGIGVHLTLTHGTPLSSRWKIKEFSRPYKGSNTANEWIGSAWRHYFSAFDKELINEEFVMQIERGIDLFGSIDHLDTDQNIAAYDPITEIYLKLAHTYGLPIRVPATLSETPVYGGDFRTSRSQYNSLRKLGYRIVDNNCYHFFQYDPNPVDSFLSTLKQSPYALEEYMFHPVVGNAGRQWGSIDVDLLTHKQIIEYTKENAILITYGTL